MLSNAAISELFLFDPLAVVLIALVGSLGLVVARFAQHYLAGDLAYRAFYRRLAAMVVAVVTLVSANHLAVLCAGWLGANLLLVSLMQHKPGWAAAAASARLARGQLLAGSAAIGLACLILYEINGTAQIAQILAGAQASPGNAVACFLLLLGAMSQSAIWPLHRWLLSSLNAPTPVSAIMHAGLVNGGGFLLIRFAPLLLQTPWLLEIAFALGILTALLGTGWKLMQHDVKRMLACSTMGQMGFMLAQCGMGLFPAALAHLCWHGMFKAYLFLSSGSAAQEARTAPQAPRGLVPVVGMLLSAMAAGGVFAWISGIDWRAGDTTLILIALAAIAGAQISRVALAGQSWLRLPPACAVAAATGALYAGSVTLIERAVLPMQLMQPQPLDTLYVGGLAALTLAWLGLPMLARLAARSPQRWAWLYVRALNASQPAASTVTAHHNHYRFA